MSLIVFTIAVVVRVIAVLWALILARRLREWRMAAIGLVIAFSLYRAGILLATGGLSEFHFLESLSTLLLSLMSLLVVLMVGKMLEERELASVRAELAIRGSNLGVWDWNLRTDRISMNMRFYELLGFEPGEIPEAFEERKSLIHPEDLDAALGTLNAHLEGRTEQYEVRYRWRTKSGEWRWFEGRGKVSRRDSAGRPIRLVGTIRDIDEQQRAEQELRENEVRFRALSEATFEGILIHDEGEILEVNQATIDLFDVSREELIGGNALDLIAPKDRERAMQGERRTYEVTGIRRNGESFPLELQVKDTVYRGRNLRVVALRDLTQRKAAQEKARQMEERFRIVVNNLPYMLTIYDDQRRVLFMNDMALKSTGKREEEILGRREEEFLPPFVEEALAPVMDEAYRKRSEQVFEYNVESEEGNFRYRIHYIPLLDEHRDVVQMIGIATDLTQERRAEEERQRLEAQMQQSQKLESLGVLAGGIAHDFNNLLMGVMGNADLALMQLPEGDENRELMESILEVSRRAAELCRQMLAYSGRGQFLIGRLDLNRIVEETKELVKVTIGLNTQLRFELGNDLPPVEGDAGQLRQVAVNLATNAAEAIGEREGVVTIRTGTMEADEAYLTATHFAEGMDAGQYVHLEVEDTGEGIDAASLERIFDPFYTTRFSGRGLGLAAVLGIVRGHGGGIRVESEPEKGSRFRVLFRPAEAKAPRDAPKLGHQEKRPAGGLVLTVDDESSVLGLTQRILEHADYDVLTATDGAEAVEIFQQRVDEIALVLMDVTMPKMGGEEAHERMRRIRPDVKVILSSGYDEAQAMKRYRAKGLAGFLQKPYRVEELIEKVRQVLAD